MTVQEYIQLKLNELRQPRGTVQPQNDDELAEAIFKILMSKKFRKYAVTPQFIEHTKQSIRDHIAAGTPINITFTHGAYKLWRFPESPQADWAELFALMHYTRWLAPICEIYKPGVWFDSFVDDLILPKINNIDISEVEAYKHSYQNIINFLAGYQPANFKMTISGVGDQFESPAVFDEKLEQDIAEYAKDFTNGLPDVTDERHAMIELNVRPGKQQNDLDWMAKNVLVHDAYLSKTKRSTNYAYRPDKILAFTQPLPNGLFIAVGSTKDSVAKFWTGVGALKPRDDSYRQLVLSPMQLEKATFDIEAISIDGLDGKNFNKIRILVE